MAGNYRTVVSNTDENVGTTDAGSVQNIIKNQQNLENSNIDSAAGAYLNGIYEYDQSEKAFALKGEFSDYTNNTDNAITTNETKIYQGVGFGSKINGDTVNKPSLAGIARDKQGDNDEVNLVEINPIGYGGMTVGKEDINAGNYSKVQSIAAESNPLHAERFDTNMNMITTTDNQLTYRSQGESSEDTFTTIDSASLPSQTVGSSAASTIIEAGKNFNRGNDKTGLPEDADINSSMVLDRSMFLNNLGNDILSLRGGSGVEFDATSGFSYSK